MASSEHLRVFIGNLITREPSGALCSATSARANFGSPPVRKTANRASSDAQSIFGRSPEPSGSTQNLRVRELLREFAGRLHKRLSLSRLVAPVAVARMTSVFHSCVITANRASSDAQRNFRVPLDLLEIPKPSFQNHRIAVIELFHPTNSFVGHKLNCAPFSGANGGQLCGRPQTFVSLTRIANSGS
jgi:hypothetical protein